MAAFETFFVNLRLLFQIFKCCKMCFTNELPRQKSSPGFQISDPCDVTKVINTYVTPSWLLVLSLD